MTRDASLALEEILSSISGIDEAVKGKTISDFETSWLLRHGVERGIEIISEASRRIPLSLKETQPHISWRDIASIGNLLRHEYHSVSAPIVWSVVQRDLPILRKAVEEMAFNARG